MLIALLPLLVAIVGLLVYVLASNPKLVEIGRLLFFCGTFVVLLVLAREVVSIKP